MKKSFLVLFTLLFSLLFGASSVYADSNKAAGKDISFLFVQTSSKGTLQAVPNKPGTYTLTLKPARPYITYFSNSPNRIAKLMSVEDFVATWYTSPNNLKRNPPNADISGVLVKDLLIKKPTNLTVELLSMKYEPKNESMTYVVHLLRGDKMLATYNKFDYIALFIDNVDDCPSCWNG
jgi:hypothetical protein